MAFIVEVRKDLAERMLSAFSKAPDDNFSFHGMPTFIKPRDGVVDWGYGGAIQEVGSKNDTYRTFKVQMFNPVHSSGTLSWVILTLAMDDERLNINDCPTQGITVESISNVGARRPGEYESGAIQLTILPEMTRWIQSLATAERENLTKKVVDAISTCYSHLMGRELTNDFAFRQSSIENDGVVHFCTEGNATYLGTANGQVDADGNQYLYTNNCDNSIQQASLLAGIAVLWEAFIRSCEAS